MDRGDGEEDVAVPHAEGLRRVGGAGGGLAHDHGTAASLHDVDELLGRTGGGSAGQDDQALLGAVPCA